MCQGFSVMQSQPPRHHDHQPPLIPYHLTSDHLHLPFSKQVTFKSIKHSVNDRPVYRSLPWTIPDSRLRFTCLYIPADAPALLWSWSTRLARSRISLQKTQHQPSQIRTQVLPKVFLLTSSPLPPSHSATHSINPPEFALTLCLLSLIVTVCLLLLLNGYLWILQPGLDSLWFRKNWSWSRTFQLWIYLLRDTIRLIQGLGLI